MVQAENLHLRGMQTCTFRINQVAPEPPYGLVLLVRLLTFFELIRDLLGHPQFRDARLVQSDELGEDVARWAKSAMSDDVSLLRAS